jgi:hypothetical protein
MHKLVSVQTPSSFMHNQGYDFFNLLQSYTAPTGSSPAVGISTMTYSRDTDRNIVKIAKTGSPDTYFNYTNGRLSYTNIGSQPIAQGDTAIAWDYVPNGSVGAGHVQTITGPGPTTSTTLPLRFTRTAPKISYSYNGALPTNESWSVNGSALGSISTAYDANLMPYQKAVTFGATSSVTYTFDNDGMVTCATPNATSCGSSTITDVLLSYGGPSCPNHRLSQTLVSNAKERYVYDSYGALKDQRANSVTGLQLEITYSGGSASRDALGRISKKGRNLV